VTTDITANVAMDNPVLGGCSLPVISKFPSLCKSEGIEPTTVMSLKPNEMTTEHITNIVSPDSNFQHLCSRRSRLRTDTWLDSHNPGTILWSLPLNSIFSDTVDSRSFHTLPLCLGILNLFEFWHCDFVFEIMVVRTGFHSGRLKLVVGYGSPDLGTDDNPYFQTVLDFNEESDTHKVSTL
jgi:hypothetical protein